MKLSDRLRRWWSPARWADDHPLEAKEHKGDIRLTNIVGRSLKARRERRGPCEGRTRLQEAALDHSAWRRNCAVTSVFTVGRGFGSLTAGAQTCSRCGKDRFPEDPLPPISAPMTPGL